MLFTLLAVLVMGTIAAALSTLDLGVHPLLAWLAFCALACVLGAAALASQPLGVSTWTGRIVGMPLRWGYGAGRGKLWAIAAISWLVWALLGSAVIVALTHPADRLLQWLVLAWTVDALALAYVCGVPIAQRSARLAMNLLPVAGVLAGMLGASLLQWLHPFLPGGIETALAIAGGPTLLVGGGYLLFLAVVLTFGRGARWN